MSLPSFFFSVAATSISVSTPKPSLARAAVARATVSSKEVVTVLPNEYLPAMGEGSFAGGSTLRPLRAVILQPPHDGGLVHRQPGAIALLELQPELVLAEELREHLAPEGADGEGLVGLRVV